MNKYLVLLMLHLISFTTGFSQGAFQHIFRNDSLTFSINHVAQTHDNGFVISGSVSDYQLFGGGPGDILMIRIDSVGAIQWMRRWDLGNDESVFSVHLTEDTCYMVGGFTFGATTNGRDGFLLKADDNGSLKWVKRVDHTGTNTIHSIRPAPGGYVYSGRSDGGAGGQYDMYLNFSDSSGNMQWGHTYGGGDWDWGWWAEPTSDGGYIMTGESQSFGIGSNDIYLVKTDSVGNKLWSKAYGSSTFEKGLWVKEIHGNFFIAGYTQGFVAGNSDAKTFLMKTDQSGFVIWMKIYAEMSSPGAIEATADSGFIITGGIYNQPGGLGGYDVNVIKTDSSGNVLWSRAYGSTGSDVGTSISLLQDGYLIGGVTSSFISPLITKAYVIKTDTAGVSGCNEAVAATTIYHASPLSVFAADQEATGITSNIPPIIITSHAITLEVQCSLPSSLMPENEAVLPNVFPNPFHEQLTVSHSSTTRITIYNTLGKLVFEKKISDDNNEEQLLFPGIDAGVYFLVVEAGNESYTLKIVKI